MFFCLLLLWCFSFCVCVVSLFLFPLLVFLLVVVGVPGMLGVGFAGGVAGGGV